jgi:tetratricopeptide (TPR) repeat protein
VPDPEDDDRAEAFDAVRLFIQAAQRVEPALDVAAERAAIVDICRQVEGLPLAIELAAAWTRVLSCRDIAAELRRGQELLRAQDSAHPARHASIGVVFDESWRRLAPVERRVLARLAVFRGGFTPEAARAVAGAALPVLGALIDKSLLRKDGQRLVLHPLLHQLAAAKLDEEAGARVATETAHAAHFHAWLQGLATASAQGRRETLMAIHGEFENCRQAWTVALALGDTGALARSSHTLLNYVENCARFDEGLVLWREATDAAPAEAGVLPLLEAQAALIEMRLGRFDDAQASAERALAAAARSDREARYQALTVLGGCALSTGRFGPARRLFLRALALARALGQHAAATLENLAIATKRLGHYEESLRLTHEALAEHRRGGDGAAEALCLSNLASLESFMDDNEAAAAHLREALALADRHCLLSTQAFARANLVEVAFKTGDMAEARAQGERALAIAAGAGIRSLVGWLQLQLAREATRRNDARSAHARLAEGIAIALALRMPWLKAAALLALAEALEARDAPADARRVLAFGAEEPTISVPDRDELRVEWARRVGGGAADAPWPALTLDALLERAKADHGFTLSR